MKYRVAVVAGGDHVTVHACRTACCWAQQLGCMHGRATGRSAFPWNTVRCLHAGCEAPANTSPTEGDLRLVPLNGTTSPTAACDDVHFGGVEIFHDGRWGRICNDRFSSSPEEFTLDAQVICRQLGFRFGGVMDADEIRNAYDGQDYRFNDERAPELVWATSVRLRLLHGISDLCQACGSTRRCMHLCQEDMQPT